MKRLVEYTLEDGGSIMVDVDPPGTTGETLRRGSPILENMGPSVVGIIAHPRERSEPPQTKVVEFGLKLSAETGAFIASVATEADSKVTLTWRREG